MILRSIKDKTKNKFNVSVAEIDYLDKWQRSIMAFVLVSNKRSYTEEVLQKIFHLLDKDFSFEILKHNIDYK